MTWDILQQYVRIGLYKVAAAAVTAGYLQTSQTEMAVGAVMGLGTLAWTVFWNKKRPA